MKDHYFGLDGLNNTQAKYAEELTVEYRNLVQSKSAIIFMTEAA